MRKRVKSGNFVVLHGWMLDLGMTANELIVFALIYGFSQDGVSTFNGSIEYIREWMGCTRKTVFNVVDKLIERGLIKKETFENNGVQSCRYMVANYTTPCKIYTTPGVKITPPRVNFAPNNIDNNIVYKEPHTPKEILKIIDIDGAWRYNKSARLATGKRLAEWIRDNTTVNAHNLDESIAMALENGRTPEEIIETAMDSETFTEFHVKMMTGGD